MQAILIGKKALSVNECWQGKRFKTPKYKQYERDMLFLLPQLTIRQGKLAIQFEFGLSNICNDVDNGVKPLMDILQKKYNFNDSKVYRLDLIKEIVKKGQEYIKIKIYDL